MSTFVDPTTGQRWRSEATPGVSDPQYLQPPPAPWPQWGQPEPPPPRPSIFQRVRGLPEHERGRLVAVLLIAFGLLTVSVVGEWGALFVAYTSSVAQSSGSTNGTGSAQSPSSFSCSGAFGGLSMALGIVVVYWNILPFLFGCIGTAMLILARSDLHRAENQGESSAVPPEWAPYFHRGIFAKGPILAVAILTIVVPLLIMMSGLFICL